MLREKQIAFCYEYIRCKNPETAALIAGYNPGYGKVLLNNSEIMDFCNRQESDFTDRLISEISNLDGVDEGETEETSVPEKEKTSALKKERAEEKKKKAKTSTPTKNENRVVDTTLKIPVKATKKQHPAEVKEQTSQPPQQSSHQNNKGIATADEVLRFLTDIMYGNETTKDGFRAAELLGKWHGLFKETGEKEESKCLVIVGEDKL